MEMKRFNQVFPIGVFCSVGLLATTAVGAVDNVALLIDHSLYNAGQIATKLDRYEEEVEDRFPVDLKIRVGSYESQSPEQVREYIQAEYNVLGLDGVILVGQIPYVIWQQDPTYGSNYGILAFFYEDLDGDFFDDDDDGWYDYHTWGTFDGPEIWSCWMRPPVMDEVGYLEDLLDEAHDYYTGAFVTEKRGLVACHEDYDNNFWPGGSTIPSMPELVGLYGIDGVDTDGQNDDRVYATDLESLLGNNSYEIVHFWSHANSALQAWDSGYVRNYEVLDFGVGNGPLIAHIYGCHSGDFINYEGSSESNITIAIAYAFSQCSGQASSGTSWSYGTEGMNLVTRGMRNGKYLGAAWKDLLDARENSEAIEQRYPSRDVHKELSGNNLFGNPFLYANYTGYIIPPGDLDGDGLINGADLPWFGDAMAGPDVLTPPVGCDAPLFEEADLDPDGDVDLADFGAYQAML